MLDSKVASRGIGYYDYIIAGAGCAGLSLAVHMIKSAQFDNKKILDIVEY